MLFLFLIFFNIPYDKFIIISGILQTSRVKPQTYLIYIFFKTFSSPVVYVGGLQYNLL